MSVLTSIPTDGFLGTSHSGASGIGIASAAFPIGTKITVKQDAATGVNAGYCTFIYLQWDNGSAVTPAAKGFGLQLEGDTDKQTYDVSAGNEYGPGAVMLGVVTDAYFAFGQCGGVICNGNATALATTILDGNFTTDGAVALGGLNTTTTDKTIVGGITDASGWILSDTAVASTTTFTIDAVYLYLIDKFAPSL